MKIFYDFQIFSSQNYGGVSRLFSELIREYSESTSIDYYLSSKISSNEYLKEIGVKILSQDRFKSKSFKKLPLLVNYISTISSLMLREYDIFHPTYYNPYFLKFLNSHPYVITVYDMIHELFPEYFPSKDRTAKNKKMLISSANRVIAISQNTKNDMIKFYNIDPKNIDVIYLGSSLKPYLGRDSLLKLPDRYLFYSGVRRGYKNFERFVSSMKTLLQRDKDLYLVCGGGGDFTTEELELLNKLGLEKKVSHCNFNNNSELSYLYQNSLAFVFPSLYEGFGIPLLEAMSCNTPMVISKSSSFPEIALDAAQYFNPLVEDSIEQAVERVIYDAQLRKKLLSKGLKRVKDFSWEKTAKKTENVYRGILENNSTKH